MIRNSLRMKGILLILLLTAISASSIAFYTIPLTRDITYRMAETHATALLDHVSDLVEAKRQEIECYRKFALETRKREMKHITSAAGGIIHNAYAASNAGEISEEFAKNRAIEQMRTIRYGKKDYMWISNFDSVLISHPDPNLHNADFSKVKDVYGNYVVPPMVEVARKKGEGFTSYWWNRLEKDSPSEKLTYSTLFAPWKWVYGTGVYVDDIEQEVDRRKKELTNDLQKLMKGKTIGKSGYMYIFDADMKMVIHPDSRLKNKKLDGLLNPKTGRSILQELMETARIKGMHLEYPWDRPEDPGNYIYEKISWVEYNKYFDWYIASSIYTDELYAESRFLTSRILFITVIIIIFSLMVGSYFLKKFLNPIEKLSGAALKVQGGDLNVRSGVIRHDEIGILAREFDAMVEKLYGHVEELDQKVTEKTRELDDNFRKLEYANSQVMESIHYAKSIQQAILPRYRSRPPEISDGFVLWRPKDIIGGDIFWTSRTEKGFLLAVIDCTGHGVPGAIMTMIACMALNQVVEDLDGAAPGAILKRLNRVVQCSLSQHSQDAASDDGMDIGLCSVDAEAGIMVFAGAHFNLYVYEDGEVRRIKGDKQSIGYKAADLNFDFKDCSFKISEKQQYYMTTDGLLGQAGGDKGLPFGRKRFLQFISRYHDSCFSDQKKALETILSRYQGDEEQRDDITVVGFTLKKERAHD